MENTPRTIRPIKVFRDGRVIILDDSKWKDTKTYSDALALNRRFLRGVDYDSAYYGRPVNDETLPLLPALLHLHTYGFLTTCSQPFMHELTTDGGRWRETWQRPFLFFQLPENDRIPRENGEKFGELLLSHPKIIVDISKDGNPIAANLPGDFHSSQERWAPRVQDLSSKRFKATNAHKRKEQPQYGSFGTGEVYPGLRDAVHFRVWSLSWEEDLDVIALMEELAIKAGIEPRYPEDGPYTSVLNLEKRDAFIS